MSEDTLVTWIDAAGNEISNIDTNNYVISQGSYSSGSKTSSLTIKQIVLQNLQKTSVFKCKVKSSLFSENSPDVVKEMTLTLLELGSYLKFSLLSYCVCLPCFNMDCKKRFFRRILDLVELSILFNNTISVFLQRSSLLVKK